MKTATDETKKVNIKVWDLPVRIFHWLLVPLIVIMLVSAKFENFEVHITAGKIIVILLTARVIWGFVGSSNARFSALIFKPRDYLDYIRKLPERKPSYSLAHSPIGSLAVIAILITLAIQVIAGLIAVDVDGLVEGPFAYYVTYEMSRYASDIHIANVDWLISLIFLHIAANVFYYFYKRDNLVKPMITGIRLVPKDKAQASPRLTSSWIGLIVAVITAAVMVWLFVQYG